MSRRLRTQIITNFQPTALKKQGWINTIIISCGWPSNSAGLLKNNYWWWHQWHIFQSLLMIWWIISMTTKPTTHRHVISYILINPWFVIKDKEAKRSIKVFKTMLPLSKSWRMAEIQHLADGMASAIFLVELVMKMSSWRHHLKGNSKEIRVRLLRSILFFDC